MKTKRPDPHRLDIMAFAADGGRLEGAWPVMSLSRLAESAAGGLPVDASVSWQAEGRRRGRAAAEPETWLHLAGTASLPMLCQRCLQPVMVPLAVDTSIRFVRTEAEAAELDAETEHDVLAASGTLDLRELLEDELLMALPYVPRHEQCPGAMGSACESLPAQVEAPDELKAPAPERPVPTYRPFEALKGWKPG